MSNILINTGGMVIIVSATTRVVVGFNSDNNKGVNNNSWRGLIRDWVGWGWVVIITIKLIMAIILIAITAIAIVAIVNIYTRTI